MPSYDGAPTIKSSTPSPLTSPAGTARHPKSLPPLSPVIVTSAGGVVCAWSAGRKAHVRRISARLGFMKAEHSERPAFRKKNSVTRLLRFLVEPQHESSFSTSSRVQQWFPRVSRELETCSDSSVGSGTDVAAKAFGLSRRSLGQSQHLAGLCPRRALRFGKPRIFDLRFAIADLSNLPTDKIGNLKSKIENLAAKPPHRACSSVG
jgi:hypothetical protein